LRGEVRVTASYNKQTDRITVSVSDTGIGIAVQDHQALFQEFTQIENSLQHKSKGTGLGLPLSKRLAELLGGEVNVESELGKGSKFSVIVPRIYKAPAASQDGQIAEKLEPHRLTVVALEDNPADSAALQTILRGSAYQLVGSRTIAEARRAAIQHQPRAVLLDVMIGDDFSWDLLKELKGAPELSQVPVIVISALEDAVKARALGADDFSSKPVERGWLLDTLERLVKRERRTRILVIDDDEVFRYVIRQELTEDNIQVLEPPSGSLGLERVGREKVRPRTIGPRPSGYDRLRSIGTLT